MARLCAIYVIYMFSVFCVWGNIKSVILPITGHASLSDSVVWLVISQRRRNYFGLSLLLYEECYLQPHLIDTCKRDQFVCLKTLADGNANNIFVCVCVCVLVGVGLEGWGRGELPGNCAFLTRMRPKIYNLSVLT